MKALLLYLLAEIVLSALVCLLLYNGYEKGQAKNLDSLFKKMTDACKNGG